MNDASTKDVSDWKPTEEELVSLGFKLNEFGKAWVWSRKSKEYPEGFPIVFHIIGMDAWSVGACLVYPKSIEELRLLISMMRT